MSAFQIKLSELYRQENPRVRGHIRIIILPS